MWLVRIIQRLQEHVQRLLEPTAKRLSDPRESVMGVNNLANHDVALVAHTAWHPISNPPTNADTDAVGEVIVAHGNGMIDLMNLEEIEVMRVDAPGIAQEAKWARVQDVVLMPVSNPEPV